MKILYNDKRNKKRLYPPNIEAPKYINTDRCKGRD